MERIAPALWPELQPPDPAFVGRAARYLASRGEARAGVAKALERQLEVSASAARRHAEEVCATPAA